MMIQHMPCDLCKGVVLLEHVTRFVYRTIMRVSDMQFGFMSRRLTALQYCECCKKII